MTAGFWDGGWIHRRRFQSSILRCSYCDNTAKCAPLNGFVEFQSSILRCSYCDDEDLRTYAKDLFGFNPLYWGVLIVTCSGTAWRERFESVSILFTEVFLLWQHSAQEISECDQPSFNPLYWGVLIVTPIWTSKKKCWSSFQSSLLRCSYCDSRCWIPWYAWTSTPFCEHLLHLAKF